MSHSYKHTPRCGDMKSKYMKGYANRVVRRKRLEEGLPQFGGYRKMFQSWDICDYETVGETFEQYYASIVRNWYSWGRFHKEPYPDKAKCRGLYEKWFVRK